VRFTFSAFLLLLFAWPSGAQDRFEVSLMSRPKRQRIPQKILRIKKITAPIVLDGTLDEEAWSQAEIATGFQQYFPSDDVKASIKTEVKVTYNNKNIYLGMKCFSEPGKPVVQSLRRDYFSSRNDNISIYLDPYDDLTNGFLFGVTPFGVQREGLVSGGDNVAIVWDNVWFSKVKRYDDHWVAEMQIPFKSIRYNDQVRQWNIQFDRTDWRQNERSTWTRVERRFKPASLSFSGRLAWDSLPPPAGSNISIIPYTSGSAFHDLENNQDLDLTGSIGADAKIALSSSLNLDLSVNPDFSNADVDQQVTNLSRFELFFPERRQFFLENSDLFGDFGFRTSRVFFSRRIGLQNPMLMGARLSGKIGDDWRIGLMNVQTENKAIEDGDDLPAQNFTVATFQKQVFGRSNISGIFVNKQIVNFDSDQSEGFDFGDINRFNQVYGLEYNLQSQNNKWEGDIYLFQSRDSEANDLAHGAFISYNVRNYRLLWSHEYVGSDYNAEAGFVPRKGYFRFGPFLSYRFYPSDLLINRHGPGLIYRTYINTEGTTTDRVATLTYDIDFMTSSELKFSWRYNFILLQRDFDPTRSSDDNVISLAEGDDFSWQDINVTYQSNVRRDFSYELGFGTGGFYNGSKTSVSGIFGYRIAPIMQFAMGYSFNQIKLPDPFPDASFWLVGPRIDFTFTDKLFWTTFIQYNEQANNMNINSRLQWRYKPVSDVFLVYTDNYLPPNFTARNRSLVFKISYWLNL